ncbi:hypothetical protein C2G38_2235281 [Gigaspora rosea]|uniref:Retrotransposon gag domain-containing protein n=1 Tax=Gigaspora rosea TaxID=44941 RepID=A0A397TQD0_9GLOM|nr:hypothetical protein C2G38_2235281 [Gigaspora rosea]
MSVHFVKNLNDCAPNPGQHNTLTNLANQIAQLNQQLQVFPAPQVNVVPPQPKLKQVEYPSFTRGDQDPITWLKEVEIANQVQEARKIPVIVPCLKGHAATWWMIRHNQAPVID